MSLFNLSLLLVVCICIAYLTLGLWLILRVDSPGGAIERFVGPNDAVRGVLFLVLWPLMLPLALLVDRRVRRRRRGRLVVPPHDWRPTR